MQYSVQEIKERLLKALDEDNNVVDMAGVLEVISILETCPITREALEQTRIGRIVNELRKKTTDDQLAKRAKRLVRNWQKLLTSQSESTPVNGETLTTPPQNPLVVGISHAGQKESHPGSPRLSRTVSPAFHKGGLPNSAKSSLSSHGIVHSKPNTPNLPQTQKSAISPPFGPRSASTPQLQAAVLSGQRSNLSPRGLSNPPVPSSSLHKNRIISPSLNRSRPQTPVGLENDSRPMTPVSVSSVSLSETPKLRRNYSQESLSNLSNSSDGERFFQRSNHSSENVLVSSTSKTDQKADVANRKRSRPDPDWITSVSSKLQKPSDTASSSKAKHTVNGIVTPASVKGADTSFSDKNGHDKANFSAKRNVMLGIKVEQEKQDRDRTSDKQIRTPKVKTTAQLIAGLQAKSGAAVVGSSVIHQIQTNQIQKEVDAPQQVVPPGALPRPRRKVGLIDAIPVTTPGPHGSLSRTKTELVEKFLQTSISPFKYDMGKEESPMSLNQDSSVDIMNSSPEAELDRPTPLIKTEPAPFDTRTQEQVPVKSEPLSLQQIYELLPPVNSEEVDLDTSYEMHEPDPVTDADIERLSNDHWVCVNGCFDSSTVWHDWTQTLTSTSYESDPLHILPYVVIDD